MLKSIKSIAESLKRIADSLERVEKSQEVMMSMSQASLQRGDEVTKSILGQFTNLLTGGKQDG